MEPSERIEQALAQSAQVLNDLRQNKEALSTISKAAEAIVNSLQNGGAVYSCGNGGSMCDAMHFAEELSGKFREERAPLAAMAISDPAHLTCSANDFGFDSVFERFVEAHCKSADVLFAISTSGKSPNILKAAEAMKRKGGLVIGLTGRPDSPLTPLSDIEIITPTNLPFSDRIQELHIKCIHIIIEIVESKIFG